VKCDVDITFILIRLKLVLDCLFNDTHMKQFDTFKLMKNQLGFKMFLFLIIKKVKAFGEQTVVLRMLSKEELIDYCGCRYIFM